mgnify:FL=1
MAKKEEVTSKVYKAVKKDGKCVLVKKQRAKPKPKAKTNATKPPTSLAPRNPVQRTLNLPSKEQIIATQQKETAIRAANTPAPKPQTTSNDKLAAELARLRNQILGVSSEKVPESVAKPEKVKRGNEQPEQTQVGIPIKDAISESSKSPQVSYNPILNKIPKYVLLEPFRAIGPDLLADARKESKADLLDALITVYYPQIVDDVEDLTKEEIITYLNQLTFDKSALVGGANGSIEGGLYDDEISQMMKHVKTFQGVIASDEIHTLSPKAAMSFIMNKDPRGAPGSHWVAVYIDTLIDKEVCYYDPLSNPPSESTRSGIKELINKIDSRNMCKLKINTMKNQDSDSDSCGFMCIRFLKDMIKGDSFKKATGYSPTTKDNSDTFEDKAEKLANKFGYI